MEQKQEKLQLELDIGTIDEIIHNYVELEQSMVSQLFFKYKNNGSTIGGFREDIWRGYSFKLFLRSSWWSNQSSLLIQKGMFLRR
ncbi:hypothetical protein P7H12_08715 [Paenibacillus larvae]|nr:hypothetical protein [Paenibacillus larvae]MDT2263653.1 hypothetical protein [Paenibacillus larvae]